jgi:two-component system sensor histidine kinase SenX3
VQPTVALVAGIAIGALVATLLMRTVLRASHQAPVDDGDAEGPGAGIAGVLDALPLPSVVVGPDDRVLRVSASARVMGLVHQGRVFPAELARTVGRVRADGRARDREIVRDPSLRDEKGLRTVEAHVAPLERGYVLIVAEDVTESRRLDTIRRDFVANVSHELKTPTGALALLAEAIAEAPDDQEAVARFAQRMNHEATRLAALVTELLDLMRVQDSGPVLAPDPLSVDAVVSEAIDATRLAADARRITIATGGTRGLVALGEQDQLVTALKNLVQNAVMYSAEGTRVAVATKEAGDSVEISVTDQGIGIPDADLDRIFERFYRVDPARSRRTGGTGLGLSIVKHVVANHGGEVTVWSVPDEGSTFTLRLPTAAVAAGRDHQ